MIKRYDIEPWGDDHCYCETHERADGDWIRYEDHAAEVERLRVEIERLRAERERLAVEYVRLRDENSAAACVATPSPGYASVREIGDDIEEDIEALEKEWESCRGRVQSHEHMRDVLLRSDGSLRTLNRIDTCGFLHCSRCGKLYDHPEEGYWHRCMTRVVRAPWVGR